jgi:hypothetical protein
VTTIGEYTFANCENLETVTCEIETPLTINANVFQDVPLGSVTLSVPAASVAAYQAATVWEDFGTISPISTVGQTFVLGNLLYTVITETNVSVSKASSGCPTGALVIPASVENNGTTYTVTVIADEAFRSCSSLTSVTIPDSVTSIGFEAFRSCSSLTTVSIPDSVTSIGGGAFRSCSSLTSVTIPDSVTTIENETFAGCEILTTFTIPDSVTSIGGIAFASCFSLTTVTIPASVTSIGNQAFFNCSSLTTVTCEIETPLTINMNVFQNVPLANVTLSVPAGSVTAYEDALVWEDFGTISPISTVGQTFVLGNLLYTVITETNVSVSKASSGCPTGDLVIPASVENNGTTYTLTAIADQAFFGCTSLTTVSIPNSVTSIGVIAFRSCTSLTSVSIPDSVTSIGASAFRNCSSLTSVTIPDSVTAIADEAFYNCTSLNSVTIPDSVTSIGYSAFYNCLSLTSVTIPDSVTAIADEAFYSCSSLTTVSIPNSVTSIGSIAFYGCVSLTTVTCEIETPLIINANVFLNVQLENVTLYVPAASLTAYEDALVWEDFGTISPISTVGQTFVLDNLLYTVITETNVSVSKASSGCPTGDLVSQPLLKMKVQLTQ